MKVSNDDTFTGKFILGGITLVDFSRKVPANACLNVNISSKEGCRGAIP